MKNIINIPIQDILHLEIELYNVSTDTIISVIENDSRNITNTIESNVWFICLEGKSFDSHQLIHNIIKSGVQYFIYNPEKTQERPNGIWVKDPIYFLGQLALIYRQKHNTPLVAITGSNGKTSSKELTNCLLSSMVNPSYHIIKNEGSFNNEFGVPFTLFRLTDQTGFGVIEIGTNHPGEIKVLSNIVLPNYAIITTIQGGHIGNFGNIKNIAKEKYDIVSGLTTNGYLFIHKNIAHPEIIKKQQKKQKFNIVWVCDETSLIKFKQNSIYGISFSYKNKDYKLPIPGIHQFYNLQLIVACIHQITIDYPNYFNEDSIEIALQSLECFTNIEGRLHKYPSLNTKYILWDDTYNANLSSFESAIHTLSLHIPIKNLYGIFGQINELGEHEIEIHQHLAELAATKFHYLCFLSNSPTLLSTFKETWCKYNQEATLFIGSLSDENIKAASSFIKTYIQQGESILFKGSRGCKIERCFQYFLE